MGNGHSISKGKLMHSIQQAYGIELKQLKFLLRGWGGDCYLGVSNTGASYFIKIHDQEMNAVFAASSREFYLPLMDQLHSMDILPHIPHPTPTGDGALSLEIGDRVVVITGFIEGEDLGFGVLPEGVIAQLGDLVGQLHSCLPQLRFDTPFIDEFKIGFEPVLTVYLSSLHTDNPEATQGQHRLQKALNPRENEVRSYLNQLKKQQAYAKSAGSHKVICHTDLHGGNLRWDKNGNLCILDWENAMIAPREHDMIFFMGEAGYRKPFWQAYVHHFPQVSLDLELLEFYFLRRGLEDISDYIIRIMVRDGGHERDQSDLDELLECLDGLKSIPYTLTEIQGFLHNG